MKQFNLIFTCKFADFARAYTGLDSTEEIMASIEDEDQIWFVEQPRKRATVSQSEFLTETDMMAFWEDSYIELRIKNKMENGVYTLNGTLEIPDVNNPYNGLEVEFDCLELEELLLDIIKRNI